MNQGDLIRMDPSQLLTLGLMGGGDTYILWIEFFIFIACLVFSSFFSGAETALTSMTKMRVKRLFSEGEEAYKKLEPWLNDPNRFLATTLVGNNFVNILASVTAANFFERILVLYFNTSYSVAYGSAVAVAVTTFSLLAFGEIMPKTYCKEHAVRISFLVIGPIDFLYRILRPLIVVLLWISNTIIRWMGGRAVKELPLITEEDIRALIEMSGREGVLEEEERDMIHSIIDFGDRTVKEIMTPRVDFQAVGAELSFEEARAIIIESGHSRIPVYEQDLDKIIGILNVKDLLRVDTRDTSFDFTKILRPPLFIPKTKKISDLLRTFQKKKNHIAIVVDEYGLTAGLVTIEDVLEEIVGDIQDEFDEDERDYEIQGDGAIHADAKINLDILSELLNVEFPEADVETLGGFISTLLGTVPKAGEEVDFENLHFAILDADERKIKKVRIIQKKQALTAGESIPPVSDSPIDNTEGRN